MSEEEKYDDLIRQKFAEKEFMFSEANWEKAEAMIDSSRKAKKVFWWSAVFAVGLITGIFLMVPLIKNDSSQMNTGHTNLSDSLVADSLSKSLQVDETKADEKLTTGYYSFVNDPLKALPDGKPSSTDNNEATAEMSNGTGDLKTTIDASHDKSDENQPIKNKSNNTGEAGSKNAPPSKIGTPLNTERNTQKKATASEGIPDLSQHATAASGLLTPIKKRTENKTRENEKDIFASIPQKAVTKKAKTYTAKKSDASKDEMKEVEGKEIESKENEANKKLVKKEESSANAADSTILENKPAEEIAAKIDALNDSVKQEEQKLAATDSIQKSDSAKVVAQEKAIAPALDGLASATFLSIDAGVNGQLGWKNNDAIEARGLTPVFGVGITHAFNQTWSFSSGLHYHGIGYLKGDSQTSNATTYDFGSTTTITTTKPRFLHYIALPLMIQFHLNDKNAILAGGSLSYLLNAKSKVEENTTYIRPIDTAFVSQNSSNDYYTKTFNPFDAAVSIGYRRKISSHFSIVAIADFGLLDIKRNSFFMKNTVERNSGLQLILSYNLFDF
jgi:hypothetical protein